MFAWVKERNRKAAILAESDKILSEVKGTSIDRGAVLGVMLPHLDNEFIAERNRIPAEFRPVFTMAWTSALTWAVAYGLEPIGEEGVQTAVYAVVDYLAKQPWFKEEVFEPIWEAVQKVMPMAMQPIGDMPPYPLAEIFTAANMAGHSLDGIVTLNFSFGMYVAFTLMGRTKLIRESLIKVS